MCAWGFTVPVRKADDASGSAPSFTPQLVETEEEDEGAGDGEEECGIRPGQRQASFPSGLASSSAAAASASAPLGFTIDLDREFGGETRALWGFRTLNHVQSACFPVCFQTDHNVVVAGA